MKILVIGAAGMIGRKLMGRLAREGVGTPRPSRQIPDKRLKAARHKKQIMPNE